MAQAAIILFRMAIDIIGAIAVLVAPHVLIELSLFIAIAFGDMTHA